MSFDPKIRSGVVLPRVKVDSGPAAPAAAPEATPPKSPAGYTVGSSFDSGARVANKAAEGRAKSGGIADDSIGRAKSGGIADDSIGRAKSGGIADDSIGRAKSGGIADDSIGRKNGIPDDSIGRGKKGGIADDSIGRKNGIPDDSIGRKKGSGIPDDSIGGGSFEAVRYALVGPDNDPDRLELRNAIFDRLENPTFAYDLPKGAKGAAETLAKGLQNLPAAQSLSAAAKKQLATVMGRLDEEGLRLLGAALEKTPKLVTTKDSQGGTLLSSLARMAMQPLGAKLAGDTTTETLLRGVLRDVVNPNRIDQGSAPTCTVTSMQFELVADEPAEYARLMADLCGPNGKATMRGGGELRVDAGDAEVDSRDWRSASQTIFQTACMEYANGRFMDFDPVAGKSVDSRTGDEQRGIKPTQQANLLQQLFGVKYSTDNLKDEKEGAKVLETLRGFNATGAQNRPVILHIDQGDYNHAVTLESVKEGRVQFRDPYGVLRSMPEALFPKYVMAVQRPMDTNIA